MKLLRNMLIMMFMALPLAAQVRDNGGNTDTVNEKDGQVPKDLSGVRANRSFTLTGNLTGGPTYDRIFGGTTSNVCASAVTFSGSGIGVQYNVIEFFSPAGGLWDGVAVNAGGTGVTDTTMTLYCDPFNPAAADQNVVLYDDDGGGGLLSAITSADGVMLTANTTYYLVISLFSPTTIGTGVYQLDFAGDVMQGPPCTITGIGYSVDGNDVDLFITGACPGGVDVYNSSTGAPLATGVVVDGTGTVTVPFYPDSYYYVVAAGDDPGNILAQTGMTVPTLGEWGLIAFLMLLCASGIFVMRRQRRA
jgi:hypothetical protein